MADSLGVIVAELVFLYSELGIDISFEKLEQALFQFDIELEGLYAMDDGLLKACS